MPSPFCGNAIEVQRPLELEQRDDVAGAGAGVPVQYLSVDLAIPDLSSVFDQAVITSNFNKPSLPIPQATTMPIEFDESQYIENILWERRGRPAEESRQRTFRTNGNNSTNGASGDFTSSFQSVDEGLDELFDSWDESDLINGYGDDDAYWSLNEEALEEFTEKAIRLLNMLLGLAMAATLDDDIRNIVDEILSGVPIDESAQSTLKETILRIFSNIFKTVQQAFSKLLEQVNAHNQDLFDQKQNEISGESTESGFGFKNWYRGNYDITDLSRDLAVEQEKYLKALERNINVFKALIQLMIELMLDAMQAGGEITKILTGVINGFNQTVEKMDEFNELIDEKLAECQAYLEEMEYIDDWDAAWDKFVNGIKHFDWDDIWGGLSGMLRSVQNWLEDNVPWYLGYPISWRLEGWQWIFGIARDPVEFGLQMAENLLDVIATALDYIGEFIDKVVYTVIWALFGWTGYLMNGEWGISSETYFGLLAGIPGLPFLTNDEGNIDPSLNGEQQSIGEVWSDWDTDDYGTHGVGDIVQWVGRFVVDDILDNVIMDNLCDAIRFVLYEGVSYAWNWVREQLGEENDWVLWFTMPFGGYGTDLLDEPGEHDYFGIEEFDVTGGDGGSTYDEDGRKAVHREDLWGYKYADTTVYDPSAILDLNIDQLVRDVRGEMIRAQNAYMVALSSSLLKSDIRRAVFRALTGLNGVSGDGDLLVNGCQLITGPATQVLDASLSAMMMRANIYNQHLLAVDNLQKLEEAKASAVASVFLTIVTIVLAIIIAIIGWWCGAEVPAALLITSALAGLGSSAANYNTQKILQDIKPYEIDEPEVIPTEEVEVADAGETVEEVLNGLDQEMAALEAELASGDSYLIKTQDGMYYIDYKALAALEQKMNALSNCIRILFYIEKAKKDVRRLVQSILTGRADRVTGEGLILSALENLLSQRSVMLSAINFQLSQFVAAKNMARQQEIAQANASESSGAQAVGGILSLLGALFAPLQVLSTALSVTGGISSGIINIALALGGEGNALGMTLNSENKELEAFFAQRENNGDSLEDKLDRMEAEAMLELMENGLVETGNRYVGLNAPLLADTYRLLQKINQMKEVLADVRSLKAKLRSVVMRELTGVSASDPDELTHVVNQANFNTSMRVAQRISSYIQTQAQVLNQAEAARKQAVVACVSGAISIALSSLALAGICTIESTSSVLYQLCEFTPVVTAVVSTLTQLISSIFSAQKDFGYYNDYDAKKEGEKEVEKNKSTDGSWESKLDEQQAEIMAQMNEDLIIQMECSMQGISANASTLFTKMDELYNMYVGLAKALQIMKNIRAVMGHSGIDTSLVDILEANRSAAMSVLGALKEAVKIIVERRNQITNAQKTVLSSSITLCIQLISASLKAAQAIKSHKIAKLSDSTAPEAKQLKDILELDCKKLSKWDAVCSFAVSVLPEIMQQLVFNHGEDPAQELKATEDAEKGKGKAEKKDKTNSSSEDGGYISFLESSDDATAAYQYNAEVYANCEPNNATVKANNDVMLEFIKNLPQQIISLVESLYDKEGKKGYAINPDPEVETGAATDDLAATAAPERTSGETSNVADVAPARMDNPTADPVATGTIGTNTDDPAAKTTPSPASDKPADQTTSEPSLAPADPLSTSASSTTVTTRSIAGSTEPGVTPSPVVSTAPARVSTGTPVTAVGKPEAQPSSGPVTTGAAPVNVKQAVAAARWRIYLGTITRTMDAAGRERVLTEAHAAIRAGASEVAPTTAATPTVPAVEVSLAQLNQRMQNTAGRITRIEQEIGKLAAQVETLRAEAAKPGSSGEVAGRLAEVEQVLAEKQAQLTVLKTKYQDLEKDVKAILISQAQQEVEALSARIVILTGELPTAAHKGKVRREIAVLTSERDQKQQQLSSLVIQLRTLSDLSSTVVAAPVSEDPADVAGMINGVKRELAIQQTRLSELQLEQQAGTLPPDKVQQLEQLSRTCQILEHRVKLLEGRDAEHVTNMDAVNTAAGQLSEEADALLASLLNVQSALSEHPLASTQDLLAGILEQVEQTGEEIDAFVRELNLLREQAQKLQDPTRLLSRAAEVEDLIEQRRQQLANLQAACWNVLAVCREVVAPVSLPQSSAEVSGQIEEIKVQANKIRDNMAAIRSEVTQILQQSLTSEWRGMSAVSATRELPEGVPAIQVIVRQDPAQAAAIIADIAQRDPKAAAAIVQVIAQEQGAAVAAVVVQEVAKIDESQSSSFAAQIVQALAQTDREQATTIAADIVQAIASSDETEGSSVAANLVQTLAVNDREQRTDVAVEIMQSIADEDLAQADQILQPIRQEAPAVAERIDVVKKETDEIVQGLQHKDARTCAVLIMGHSPALTPEMVGDIIVDLSLSSPKKAEKVYQAITARQGEDYFSEATQVQLAAALPALHIPTAPAAPIEPQSASPTTSHDNTYAYDQWVESMQVGKQVARTEKRASSLHEKVETVRKNTRTVMERTDEALANSAATVLQTVNEEGQSISPEDRLSMLQGEIRSLAHEKHRLQVRIRQLREQVLPKAQEKAARTLVAIEAEAQVVRNRQAMVSDRIEFLQGKASLTPEEQLELTNLQTENRDLSRTLERLDRSKALCNDVVRDVERDIAELEAKINTVNTALSLLKSERAGLIRKISVAQGSEPAARNEERASSRRTHSRSSLSEGRTSAEQDIVVATADAGGGGGEGEEGGSQGGSPDGRRSWNPFAWFSGHKEDKEAVRASADSRISYQVGNMPGDNVGEQYERVLEEANYIRSA